MLGVCVERNRDLCTFYGDEWRAGIRDVWRKDLMGRDVDSRSGGDCVAAGRRDVVGI